MVKPLSNSLCKPCQAIFTAVQELPAGCWLGWNSWSGSKPRSFGYAYAEDSWGGSHHTREGSFLHSVQHGCYICLTIYQECNDVLKKNVGRFETFFRFYKSGEPTTLQHGECYSIQFGIEVAQAGQPGVAEIAYECQGDFKLLQYKGISSRDRAQIFHVSGPI